MNTNKATKHEMQALYAACDIHCRVAGLCARIKKPIAFLTLDEWASDMGRATSNATDVKPIGASFVSEGIVSVTFNKKVQGFTVHKYADIGIAGLYGAEDCIFNSEYGIALVFDSYDKVVEKDGVWKPRKRG